MQLQANIPRSFTVKGNEPVVLTGNELAWQVETGQLALFAIPAGGGARQYLMNIDAGEILPSLTLVNQQDNANQQDQTTDSYTTLAVAIEKTDLRPLDEAALISWMEENPVAVKSAIQTWSHKVSYIFPDLAIPNNLTWQAFANDWDSLKSALAALQAKFLQQIQQQETQRRLNYAAQFEERTRLNQQATVKALSNLTAVFKPRVAEHLSQDSELLMAAGAVGRVLGIVIHPPARSENLDRLKEPLAAIARASRIRTRQVLLSDQWWQKDCGPLLAFLGERKRPVALIPRKAAHYEVFDPQQSERYALTAEVLEQLHPLAYTFYRPLPKEAFKALEFFRFSLWGLRRDISVILLAGVTATLMGMLTPQATAILIDKAIPDANRGLLLQIGLGLVATSFGSALFQLVQSFATLRLQSLSDAGTQAAIWDRLLTLRVSFFRRYAIGDLAARVSTISQMRSLLSGTVVQTLLSGLFALLNWGLMVFYNAKLAWVALAVAIVTFVITAILGRLIRRQLRPLQQLEGVISGLLVQLIGGISKLRVAAAEERAFAYWAKYYHQQLTLILSTELIEDSLALFNTILPTVSAMILFWLAAQLIGQTDITGGGLSTGTFLAFNTAFGTFIGGTVQLSNTLGTLLEVTTLWERAKPILEEVPEVDLSKADPGQLMGNVLIERVSFRYRPEAPLTLENITIKAQSGEFIALVGPSGSGKSTLVRLLLGFETAEDGSIYYDGQDLSGLDITAIRRQLGVVLQNGRINSASIFENITCGAIASMDEVWDAAKMAGFADDIEAMPMGMHTIISEGGSNLSGGQRQRLLIARALVLKPKVLIFDEATSALDNRTQAVVSESLERLRVTRIVIAHRLSTIQNADRIYVLNSGRIEQQGAFMELMQQPGLFANLMARQIA